MYLANLRHAKQQNDLIKPVAVIFGLSVVLFEVIVKNGGNYLPKRYQLEKHREPESAVVLDNQFWQLFFVELADFLFEVGNVFIMCAIRFFLNFFYHFISNLCLKCFNYKFIHLFKNKGCMI